MVGVGLGRGDGDGETAGLGLGAGDGEGAGDGLADTDADATAEGDGLGLGAGAAPPLNGPPEQDHGPEADHDRGDDDGCDHAAACARDAQRRAALLEDHRHGRQEPAVRIAGRSRPNPEDRAGRVIGDQAVGALMVQAGRRGVRAPSASMVPRRNCLTPWSVDRSQVRTCLQDPRDGSGAGRGGAIDGIRGPGFHSCHAVILRTVTRSVRRVRRSLRLTEPVGVPSRTHRRHAARNGGMPSFAATSCVKR